jgi:hypothetical protein
MPKAKSSDEAQTGTKEFSVRWSQAASFIKAGALISRLYNKKGIIYVTLVPCASPNSPRKKKKI